MNSIDNKYKNALLKNKTEFDKTEHTKVCPQLQSLTDFPALTKSSVSHNDKQK